MAHAFATVDKVIFHIGEKNIRSQMAIERLGAVKFGQAQIAYYGERLQLNYFYAITKADWIEQQKAK
jgi:RimJ/RimL family protein N-acetyltransferase